VNLPQQFDRLARKEDAVRFAHLHALGRNVPLCRVEVEFGSLRAQQLALARHRVEQQPGRSDHCDVRALVVELAPEGTELLLVQVLVMLDRRPRNGAAQRLRRVRRHQQVADRVGCRPAG
jgi:hypothetical protein